MSIFSKSAPTNIEITPKMIEAAEANGWDAEKIKDVLTRAVNSGQSEEEIIGFITKHRKPLTEEELEELDIAYEEHEEQIQKEMEAIEEEHDKEIAEKAQQFTVIEYPDEVDWNFIYHDKFNGLPNNMIITSNTDPTLKVRFYDKIQTGPTNYFVVDLEKNICEIVRVKKDKQTNDWFESGKIRQASFGLSNLKIYTSIPVIYSTEAYSFTVTTNDGQKKRINSKTVDECVGEIKTRGLFEATKKATDTFNRIVKCLRNCEEFESELKPPKHGFFLVNRDLISRREFNELPCKDEMNQALQMFEDFGDQYNEIQGVFGFMAHWHLMAPFNFALKQQHGKDLISTMPYILFYGTSRLGKDTIGNFGSLIWRKQLDSWSKGQIHSEAQLGEALSEGTYPIIASEGEDVLLPEKKGGFGGIIKDATEGLKVRRKMINGVQTTIPSLSLMVITSNSKTIDTAALSERVGLFDYGTGRRRSLEERKAFVQRFKPTKLNGPLEIVGAMGDFVGYTMMHEPRRIKEAWFDTAVQLMHEMYAYAGRPMPEWLKRPEQPQRLEQGFEREDENYIENILSYIIRDAHPDHKKEQITDDNGRVLETIELPITRQDKAEFVVEENYYPWIFRRVIENNRNPEYNGNFVYLSKSIETDLHRDLGFNIGLEKIADLLGGKYKRKTVRQPNDSSRKKFYAIFKYEDFMKLYGEIGEDEVEE